MTEKRVARSRSRIIESRPTGGASAALSRRTGHGRGEPKKGVGVAVFFGNDGDEPIIELLKSVRLQTDTFRTGDYVHVSDVISKCVRKIALMRRLKMRHPQEPIIDGRAITFAIGEAVHDFVKAKFTKGHPSKIWADWKCACGATTSQGTFDARAVKACKECGTPVDKHHEVSFVDDEFMLKGTPDLLLWMDEYGAFYIVEIKSIAAAAWKELVRPIPDHKIQIALYWAILKKLGIPVVDKVSILYANKEFSFKLPYKEYMFSPEDVDLSPYWGDLQALKDSEDGGPLPPRVMCGTESSPEAKKCPVCASCFGCD